MATKPSTLKKSDRLPIFILGSARSGTTWLSNIICSHPQVACAEHIVHWGNKASNLFRIYKYAGDLRKDSNFIQFLETYASTDDFKILKGDKEYFYRNRPDNVFEFYFMLMDQYATQIDVKKWATKLDPMFFYHDKSFLFFMGEVQKRYEKFRFLGIKRGFSQVIDSYFNMEGKSSAHKKNPLANQSAAIIESARYVVHNHSMETIIKKYNGLLLHYNNLKNNYNDQIKKICRYISIDYAPDIMISKYPANSSYLQPSLKRNPQKKLIKKAQKAYLIFLNNLPLIGKYLLILRDGIRRKRAPFYWRLLRLEYMESSFAKELQDTGEFSLYNLIFKGEKQTEKDKN